MSLKKLVSDKQQNEKNTLNQIMRTKISNY